MSVTIAFDFDITAHTGKEPERVQFKIDLSQYDYELQPIAAIEQMGGLICGHLAARLRASSEYWDGLRL